MMRGTRLLCVLIAAYASVSCGKKHDAPERRAPAASTDESPAAAKAEGDVGVGDAVDYAIGKKQIDAKKRMESQIRDIQEDRNRRIEEALGE
ncbi:MAG: hypothetical protein ACYTKD_01900 [Planctomycetota bacterium]|jgi:hypothetical protein